LTGVESEVTECTRMTYLCGEKPATLNVGDNLPLGSDPYDTEGDGDTDNDIEVFSVTPPAGSGILISACICVTDLDGEGVKTPTKVR